VPIFIGRGAPLCQLHVLHSRTKAAFARVPSARARPNLRDEQLAGDQPVQAREFTFPSSELDGVNTPSGCRIGDWLWSVSTGQLPLRLGAARFCSVISIWRGFILNSTKGVRLLCCRLNHKHATLAGLCTIVPTSSQQPRTIGPEDVLIPVGSYWSFDEDTWVRAKNITTVSHTRLSLLHYNGRPRSTEFLNDKDMARVELAVKHAMGIP
jgi:PemK-like, MazF-like toxin of type II toxin-antitoxin system